MNEKLIVRGLARVAFNQSQGRPAREEVEKLENGEKKARGQHAGIFEHGDPGDSDEEL